jgi:hypothetical protein
VQQAYLDAAEDGIDGADMTIVIRPMERRVGV